MNRPYALKKLEAKLANPDRRTIEENAPVIILTNGKHIMVERCFPMVDRQLSYRVSYDFGCTCREIGVVPNLDGVLDLILREAN